MGTPAKERPRPENAITIAVSSRLLFNMEEQQPFSPGPAFSFVKALEAVNTQLRELYPDSEELFDVVLMTNQAHDDQRLIKTIKHHQLYIKGYRLKGENSPISDLKACHINLYLSDDPVRVRQVLEAGIAAATMVPPKEITEVSQTELRVVFDGDGVLFSDESERIFKEGGLAQYLEHEKTHENQPLNPGPLKGFLEVLGKLQKKFYDKGRRKNCPIKTYLVTARDAGSAGYRALKTVRSWDLEIDRAVFLDGEPKGATLEKIRPHIFLDDQMRHVNGAAEVGTVACHVAYGISNL
ncbi:cytosolic 5'-nucleotidase 1A-like [Micropterus dolomieu]|uniref:cytosolic 5'-nucleotidase 1A-like n=1 Tax=Micropterus dolomieu TaxID=147949 RepID=UPI001E8ECD81|nr:cytosolic 5'-nucleotidase 1A-like [Micropterus dolomieu]XP_045898883.1 cytosolic 5'-nucleotidase 1A-like [Micropterus dolomieu]